METTENVIGIVHILFASLFLRVIKKEIVYSDILVIIIKYNKSSDTTDTILIRKSKPMETV